jgi:uncharacterized protein with GYD domain
MQVMERVSPL